MTLMELIVAVAVLAILLLGFSVVFSQSHRVVSTAQSAMRANAKAAAITSVLRRDIKRASQQGFLYLGYDDDGRPRLIITAAGPTPSVTGPVRGNGAVVCLGARPKADAADEEFILWRAGYVLSPSGDDPDIFRLGGNNVTQGDIQAAARPQMQAWCTSLCSGSYNDQLTVPPTNLSQLGEVWQVLSAWCTELEIAWTDGSVVGTALQWQTTSELWTHHDQNDWPMAIRFRFRLVDPTLPEEMRGAGEDEYRYEVICPVGR
ncbi:MAG: hypothetical protein KGY99_05725 [Phycisphaerae bacterium]|nr:hypothetical protein [Phycisphaerae bacterium]